MRGRVWLAGLMVTALAAPLARAEERGMPPSKPGPEHERLAKLAGEYTTVSTFRAQPDAKPMESKGTATIRRILGGRFLKEESRGTFMGQPTEGVRLTGYNSPAGRYEATWVYTHSLAMMTLSGESKDDGKTIEWTGTVEQGKGQKMTLYVVTHFIDDDHFVVELHAERPGEGKGPVFETAYTRKK